MCYLCQIDLQICERSLTSTTGGPAGPPTSTFVRAEMLPSGYLVRPCEGGGSIIHIVDHVDLDVRILSDKIFPIPILLNIDLFKCLIILYAFLFIQMHCNFKCSCCVFFLWNFCCALGLERS